MLSSDFDEPSMENPTVQKNNNKQNFDYLSVFVQPKFQDFQMLGDSIFVRFADKVLGQTYRYVDGSSQIGYCVSGQRIKQLAIKIKKNIYYLHKQVILLIGTNDVLCGRTLNEMTYDYNNLILLLESRGVSKVIILTLPPIPRLALTRRHWETVRGFNTFLIGLSGGASSIKTFDILPLFVKRDMPVIAAPPVTPYTPTYSLRPSRKPKWSQDYKDSSNSESGVKGYIDTTPPGFSLVTPRRKIERFNDSMTDECAGKWLCTSPSFSLGTPKRKIEWCSQSTLKTDQNLDLSPTSCFMGTPKRKIDTCTESQLESSKKRKVIEDPALICEDDSKVSKFGRYLNRVNRQEAAEDRIESDDDEGSVKPLKPFIEFTFWRRIQSSILMNPQEDYDVPFRPHLPPPEIRDSLASPTTTGLELNGDIGPDDCQSLSNLPDNHKLIIQYSNKFLRLNYFEMMMGMGHQQRMDMIHPNRVGLRCIHDFLKFSLSSAVTQSSEDEATESWI